MKHIKETLTLTIVIPAFNEEGLLSKCLDSIAAQSMQPAEVIVVDNNSTDKTAEIASSYDFVRVLKESEQGIVFARSTGFNSSKSDIIARIDADTVLPKNWVRSVIAYFAANQPDAITGPCHIRDWYGKWIFFYIHRLVFFVATRVFVGHNTLFGSNMAISQKAWQAVYGQSCVRTDLHEDMDLACHLKINGMQIDFVRHIQATISPRRVKRMGKYPKMWLKTNILHNRVAQTREATNRSS